MEKKKQNQIERWGILQFDTELESGLKRAKKYKRIN